MIPRYSIAEARNRFTEIVHDLESVGRVEVTRRGQRVAILISVEEYERTCGKRASFWEALTAFRERSDLAQHGVDDTFLEGLRDRAPAREIDL